MTKGVIVAKKKKCHNFFIIGDLFGLVYFVKIKSLLLKGL